MRCTTSLVVAVLAIASGACVGPSRTQSDYERKIANSAEAAVSTIESARLTVATVQAAKSPPRYIALRLSESEETAHAVETALGSVQPPDAGLDDLRTQALTALSDAADVLEELRIAAYRGELERLPGIAKGLEDPLARLRELMEIAPT